MYAFEYHRPHTLSGAVADLAKADAKALAGGMTLLPTMKQRLASPAALVDLKSVPELAGIAREGDNLVIGAMSRHADVARNTIVKAAIPALAKLAGGIGDPHVRNMGTIGGSIANNDPSADYPAAALALGATIVTNKRRIPAQDFFTGLFETALEAGRAHHEREFPDPAEGGLYEIRQPRLTLRPGRRVRRQDGRRRPRRGDRRRLERRLSRQRARSGARAPISRRPRSRASPCPQAASIRTSTPTPTIAPT